MLKCTVLMIARNEIDCMVVELKFLVCMHEQGWNLLFSLPNRE